MVVLILVIWGTSTLIFSVSALMDVLSRSSPELLSPYSHQSWFCVRKYFFRCVALFHSFICKMSVQFICPFIEYIIWVFVFKFLNYLYSTDINPLSSKYLVISCSVNYLFILIIVSFAIKKMFQLIFILFYLLLAYLCVVVDMYECVCVCVYICVWDHSHTNQVCGGQKTTFGIWFLPSPTFWGRIFLIFAILPTLEQLAWELSVNSPISASCLTVEDLGLQICNITSSYFLWVPGITLRMSAVCSKHLSWVNHLAEPKRFGT